MAQQREKGGRVVFIGNIPYGVSEEQICDIFGRCGTVVSFRLVYDKETGRPKGFGFLEFTDADAAAAAVRNLNEYDLNGRTLRVDYSNENDKGNRGGGAGGAGPGPGGMMGGGAPPPAMLGGDYQAAPPPFNPAGADGSAVLPPLPPGVDLPPGLSAPDAISATIANIPPAQLLDYISMMKTMAQAQPAQATALLASQPQLSYAIFQALLLMGLVGTDVIQSLVQAMGPQAAAPPPQPQQPPPAAYAPPPQQQQHSYPPQPAYTQQPTYGAPHGYAPTPPQQQPTYAPPPAAAPPGLDEQTVRTVLGLTAQQIFDLPEAARGQILALRAQLGAAPL